MILIGILAIKLWSWRHIFILRLTVLMSGTSSTFCKRNPYREDYKIRGKYAKNAQGQNNPASPSNQPNSELGDVGFKICDGFYAHCLVLSSRTSLERSVSLEFLIFYENDVNTWKVIIFMVENASVFEPRSVLVTVFSFNIKKL